MSENAASNMRRLWLIRRMTGSLSRVFRSYRTGERIARGPACIYLDTHMLCGVYQESGICVRNHCGAEPPRDTEPPGFVATVRWRDRASTSYAAADRVKAPASAARGRFRGIHGR